MRALALAVLASCAVTPARGPGGPTDPAAPTGRLAGPPPALRVNVVSYPDVPPLRAPSDGGGHEHHHPQAK